MSEHRVALVTNKDIDILAGALGNNSSDDVQEIISRLRETIADYDPKKIEMAIDQYGCDGEIEIDEGAVCSRGDDPGCYVMAWVWVYDEQEAEEAA